MQSDRAILPPETRIGRTALTVVDLTAMVDFYQDIVGLTVLRHTDTTAVLGVEETPLLVLEGDSAARTLHRSGAGLFHNAFRVPTREALGDAYDRIQEHWHLGGASDHGVSEALYINDPEGNGIEIYRDYPRREWPRGDDGQIQMGTHPLPLKPVSAASAGGSDLPAGTDLGPHSPRSILTGCIQLALRGRHWVRETGGATGCTLCCCRWLPPSYRCEHVEPTIQASRRQRAGLVRSTPSRYGDTLCHPGPYC